MRRWLMTFRVIRFTELDGAPLESRPILGDPLRCTIRPVVILEITVLRLGGNDTNWNSPRVNGDPDGNFRN